MTNDKILISRQAYEKMMQVTKPAEPVMDATINQLHYNEACRVIQKRIERWFECA